MLVLLVIFLSAISTFITVFMWDAPLGYTLLPFLPLSFMFLYIFFIHKSIVKNKSIVATLFALFGAIRYLIAPAAVALANDQTAIYNFISNYKSIDKAIFLMIYEMFILSITIYLVTNYFEGKKSLNKKTEQKTALVSLKGERKVYYLLGIVALLLFLITPSLRDSISFVIIKYSEGVRAEENLSISVMAMRQIFIVAVAFLFLTIINITKKKYQIKGKLMYFYFSLFFALLNVSIIIGERRMLQIYTAFATVFVLISIYPSFKKTILLVVGSAVSLIVGLMSVFKIFSVFLYGSYSDALNSSTFNIQEFAIRMQYDFAGPQNVAIALEIAKFEFQPIYRMFYDFARTTFGTSFLVKDLMYTSSDVFNEHIYGTFMSSGHVLSGIGYGYMYFGFLLAPILSVIGLIMAVKLEQILKTTNSLEVKYILAYIIIRFAAPFTNLPAKFNIASLTLFSFGVIYLFALLIRKSRN